MLGVGTHEVRVIANIFTQIDMRMKCKSLRYLMLLHCPLFVVDTLTPSWFHGSLRAWVRRRSNEVTIGHFKTQAVSITLYGDSLLLMSIGQL